jgi:hypothetical protein
VPILDDVAEGVLKLLFHFFIEVLFFYTGDVSCMLLPLEARNLDGITTQNEEPLRFVIRTEIVWWIGFFFWVVLIGRLISSMLLAFAVERRTTEIQVYAGTATTVRSS